MTELILVAPAEWTDGLPEALALHRPDIRVTVASQPDDPGWSSPDAVWWSAFQPPGIPPHGSVPLDDMAAAAGLDLKPFGRLADLERAGGQLHALPVSYRVPALHYNLAILERCGTPPPRADLTWTGMVALAETLRDAGVQVPFGDGAHGWAAAFLAWQDGADPEEPDALYPFVAMVRDLRRRAVTSESESFGEGRTALAINDCGAEACNAGPNLRWGVAPFPLLDAGRSSRARWHRSHAYVHRRSGHPREAFAAVEFILTWAVTLGPAVLGEFAVLGSEGVGAGPVAPMPMGQAALRAAAEATAPEEWDAGADYADGRLWAALGAAIDQGWDLDTFAARVASARAAAPT